jgi:hypothetical protein
MRGKSCTERSCQEVLKPCLMLFDRSASWGYTFSIGLHVGLSCFRTGELTDINALKHNLVMSLDSDLYFCKFYVFYTVHILIIIISTNLCTEWNLFMCYYKASTCFGTEVSSIVSGSIQMNVCPTHQSNYYVSLTEVSKILKIKILKCIQLITIKLQRCYMKCVTN